VTSTSGTGIMEMKGTDADSHRFELFAESGGTRSASASMPSGREAWRDELLR